MNYYTHLINIKFRIFIKISKKHLKNHAICAILFYMMMAEPQYATEKNKTVCINAKVVIDSIKQCFPLETYKTLAERADVHIQTVLRWVSVGRAEESAIRRLVLSLEQEGDYDTILLKDATPSQLRRRCQLIGWDKVINSPKKGELFMKIEEAQKQIAEKLRYSDNWTDILNDCNPGIYGVEDWEANVDSDNIWVNFPNMEFSFKDVDFDFEVRIGGSREDDSIDEQYHRTASGKGKFECSGGKVTDIYDVEIDCDLDLTEGGRVTRA
jgi:hypothetical protein